MRPLTIRTTSQRREETEMRKPEQPPAAEDTLRGKRVRLSSKHPAYYYYNKSARGKWNRASQVVEGMWWNAYKSSGKETPLPCPLHVPEIAPLMGGRMKELEGEKSPERLKASGKKGKEGCVRLPHAARAEKERAPETQARHDYQAHHENAGGLAHDAAGLRNHESESIISPRLEHDFALHEGIQAGGSGGRNVAAGSDESCNGPVLRSMAPAGTAAQTSHLDSQPRTAVQADGGHLPADAHARKDSSEESHPAAARMETGAPIIPLPHPGSAPDAAALRHAPAPSQTPEGNAPAEAAAHAARSADIIHHAEGPGAPPIAVQDVRVPRGPGYLSSAAKKVVQLKVARADAQPPGDI